MTKHSVAILAQILFQTFFAHRELSPVAGFVGAMAKSESDSDEPEAWKEAMPTKDSVGDEPLVTPGSTLAMTIRRIREMCHQRALHKRHFANLTTKKEQQMKKKKKKKSKPVRVWESTKPGDKPKHPGLQSMSQC